MLFSTHILPEVEALCDRVSIIRDGVITRTLGLDELMRLGEGTVEITARGVRPGSLGALHEHVSTAGERGEETFIVVREQRFVRAVIEHLYEHGADVLEVANERRSLEDIFMKEMARSVRSDRPNAGSAKSPREPVAAAGSPRRSA